MAAMARQVALANAHMVSSVPVAGGSHRSMAAPREADWTAFVLQAASEEHAGLARLYDASSAMLFGLALRILGDRDAAEDAVVEVYTQAWKDAKTYDPRRGTAASWLLTLTRSRAIDSLRARRRDDLADPIESASDIRAATPDPEEASTIAERERLVRGALSGLNLEQRQAIELAYFSGLSHTEIALKLGQPLGTIKTRIRLGMLRMRELLDHLAPPLVCTSKEGV